MTNIQEKIFCVEPMSFNQDGMNSSVKVAIIGAGVTGLSVAQILKSKGIDVRVFEASDTVGGLISCSIESGHLFHKVGGHVFNSRSHIVNDWFWSRFNKETEFREARRNAVVYMNKSFVCYPVERSIASFGHDDATKIVNELIELCSVRHRAMTTVQEASNGQSSFGNFLLSNFGPTLCERYFFPYNRKIWNRDLFSIPLPWLHGKLPMAQPDEILISNILGSEEKDMVHSTFYYPVDGGSQFIADRLSEGIDIVHEKIVSISRKDGSFYVNGDKHAFDNVVSTIDVRLLPSILCGPELESIRALVIEEEVATSLDSNGTSNLLCECDANDYSWVYLPESSTKFHRIIMTGNFSPHNNSASLQNGRTTCTVEASGFHTKESLEAEICTLPFNLKPIAYNHCPNSYIIHTKDTEMAIRRIKELSQPNGIYLCGRFAEWKYFNMDAAIESALSTCFQLIESLA